MVASNIHGIICNQNGVTCQQTAYICWQTGDMWIHWFQVVTIVSKELLTYELALLGAVVSGLSYLACFSLPVVLHDTGYEDWLILMDGDIGAIAVEDTCEEPAMLF